MARARGLSIFLLTLLSLTGCQPDRQPVRVFHAGSLSALMARAGQRFQQHNPAVLVQGESSGSLDAVRKITELGKRCDIVALADYRLIPRMLGHKRVSRAYVFLGNELVLAGRMLKDPAEKQAWQEDWYERLASGRYSYATSDRDRDPAGYYAHLAWKLAEFHYARPALYRTLLEAQSPRWVRPRSSELVALLETGTVDLAFLYKSTALQNNLNFIALPPQISLAEDNYAPFYGRAFVLVAGGTPDSREEIVGAPIRYGIGLLRGASKEGRSFFDFLLSPEVQDLYRELGYAGVPIQEMRLQE